MKTFLQSLLQKSLPKDFLPKGLLLLVVLFVGGCSTIDDALDIASGKTGTYYTGETTAETFKISTDGLEYSNYTTSDATGEAEYKLGYASSGSDYIEYVGFTSSSSDTYIRVVLSDITDSNGGTRTVYNSFDDDDLVSEYGFTWFANTSK